MNPNRILQLHPSIRNEKITYIMFNSFRVNNNHALEHALNLSKTRDDLSIVLLRIKEENERNNDFLLQGISNYKTVLEPFSNNVLYIEENDNLDIFQNNDIIVTDMTYLKEEKHIVERLKELCIDNNIGLEMVETNTIVPITISSDKEEYSARTIRPKIWRQLPVYLDYIEHKKVLFTYEKKAMETLYKFGDEKLMHYDKRNHPETEYTSQLSKYLKYGFISPLTIYGYIDTLSSVNKDSFFEELIIRRDLAYNFTYYNKDYNVFEGMTYEWAYQTMKIHTFDHREYLYTMKDYINFKTHDPYFNTAMKEMVYFGTMSGYMRMYWGKKIIEWSRAYKEAYNTMIYLNNYYFLDGNNPNGYAGVAWCFGKHDRAWTERDIFGKLRYMNMNGLKRKFDIDQYVERINKKVDELNEGI